LKSYPVTYHGLVPDTFTDTDIEAVVEGRLGRDGVIQATDVLAIVGLGVRGGSQSLSAGAAEIAARIS
jgi:hypothetical protein